MHLVCTCIAKHYIKEKKRKRNLYNILFHFVQKNIRSLQIKISVFMGKVEINVSEFYGVPAFYSVMPRDIFDTLELAALKGDKTATVDQEQFDNMMLDYKKKIA